MRSVRGDFEDTHDSRCPAGAMNDVCRAYIFFHVSGRYYKYTMESVVSTPAAFMDMSATVAEHSARISNLQRAKAQAEADIKAKKAALSAAQAQLEKSENAVKEADKSVESSKAEAEEAAQKKAEAEKAMASASACIADRSVSITKPTTEMPVAPRSAAPVVAIAGTPRYALPPSPPPLTPRDLDLFQMTTVAKYPVQTAPPGARAVPQYLSPAPAPTPVISRSLATSTGAPPTEAMSKAIQRLAEVKEIVAKRESELAVKQAEDAQASARMQVSERGFFLAQSARTAAKVALKAAEIALSGAQEMFDKICSALERADDEVAKLADSIGDIKESITDEKDEKAEKADDTEGPSTDSEPKPESASPEESSPEAAATEGDQSAAPSGKDDSKSEETSYQKTFDKSMVPKIARRSGRS